MTALSDIRARAFTALRPPPKLDLSEWAEANVRLPSSIAAQPGPLRLWPHQRAIADSMGDPRVERVTVLKSARVGYSQLLTAAIGSFAVNDPGPILAVLPAEADCRHFMIQNIEPTFAESPSLRGAIQKDTAGRDTMLERFFPGGSLALVSANAPRNLRAKTARVLILDEVDGFEIDARGEGDPVALAEKRTLSYSNRKIVLGSTPVDLETSRVCREYAKSDQRVFECPCPHCGDFHEIAWRDIRWESDRPETATWACPSCGAVTEESDKAAMIHAGRWRPTRPEVQGHHGYRVNALVSLLPNASWPNLAREFLEAKKSPVTLKPFVNTVLGEPWRGEGDDLDNAALTACLAPIGLDAIPADVVALTAGTDLQDDRLEVSTVGFTAEGVIYVLAHDVVWGSPLDDATWIELDALLARRWGPLSIRAAVIDSGHHADAVYAFTRPRMHRRIVAGKGVSGFGKQALAWGQSRKTKLALVGVDPIKLQIHQRINACSIQFAESLGQDHLDQLASERLITKYNYGHPVRRWEKISGRRNEAFDCLGYAIAARQLLPAGLKHIAQVSPKPQLARSAFLYRR